MGVESQLYKEPVEAMEMRGKWRLRGSSVCAMLYKTVVIACSFGILSLITFPSNICWLYPRLLLSAKNAWTFGTKMSVEEYGVKHLQRTLVNVTEDVAGASSYSKISNSLAKRILWCNKPNFINLTFVNWALLSKCSYKNCQVSTDRRSIQNYSAIIFSMSDPLEFWPPVLPGDRNPNQVWMFYNIEPPVHQGFLSQRYISWRDTMNWSMSYRRDADIFYPYGTLTPSKLLVERDYGMLYRRKTKLAAWIVSHCGAPSGRDEYVNELRKWGLDVTIFGRCGDNIYRDQDELLDLVNRDFKFLLSFENNFCRDYISEKYFSFYNLDVILVVRGGGEYDKLLPKNVSINSADFSSPAMSAKYLLKVANSEKLYSEYLERKNTYTATDLFTMPTAYCNMCQKLNNLNENIKRYSDHIAFIHKNACWTQTDLSKSHNKLAKLMMHVFLVSVFVLLGAIFAKHCI